MLRHNFIIFSDLHLHDWKNFNEEGRRLQVHVDIVVRIWEKALEEKRPVFFAGDFIHKGTEISMNLLKVLVTLCRKLMVMKSIYKPDEVDHIKIYAIDGNHDQDSSNRWDTPSNNIIEILALLFPEVFVDISNWCRPLHMGDYHIYGLSYFRYNDGLDIGVEKIKEQIDRKKTNILFIHTVLPGSTDSDGREVPEQGRPMGSISKVFDGFDFVFCGHVHKHYNFGGNVYNIGAPNQQRLTDLGTKMGYLLFDEDIVKRVIFKDLPQFKKYKGDTPPDTFHFWVKEDEEREEEEGEIPQPKGTSMKSLVRGYSKAMGFKDKQDEMERLTQLLEEKDND